MSLPKLFSYDSKNRIKEWYVTVEGDTFKVFSGLKSGKVSCKSTTKCTGKNIGKANETTPEQQAEKEALAKWTKQKDKNYHEVLGEAKEKTLPMLAGKYQDNSHKVNWPWYGLYKLDGVRCTVFCEDGKVRFQSRGGKDYPVIEEIAEELLDNYFLDNHELVFDGELYSHKYHLEDIVSAVKKHNIMTPDLVFYMFDMYDPAKPDQSYRDRYIDLKNLNALKDHCEIDRTNVIKRVTLESEQDMLRLHEQATKEGFEGVVLRDPEAPYVFNQRKTTFLKYKESLDKEFKVVDIVLDKNGGGIPVCEIEISTQDEPVQFKANYAGTHEFRRLLAENSNEYIGKWLTVEFESYSKYGVPLKPIGKCFREVNEKGAVLE